MSLSQYVYRSPPIEHPWCIVHRCTYLSLDLLLFIIISLITADMQWRMRKRFFFSLPPHWSKVTRHDMTSNRLLLKKKSVNDWKSLLPKLGESVSEILVPRLFFLKLYRRSNQDPIQKYLQVWLRHLDSSWSIFFFTKETEQKIEEKRNPNKNSCCGVNWTELHFTLLQPFSSPNRCCYHYGPNVQPVNFKPPLLLM